MSDGTGRSRASDDYPSGFAQNLAQWMIEHEGLVVGLAALRDLGDEADAAVAAILELRPLLRARLSWELWERIVLASGRDPETVLLSAFPPAQLEWVSYAIFGNDWRALSYLWAEGGDR
jgi:hypothetical protein